MRYVIFTKFDQHTSEGECSDCVENFLKYSFLNKTSTWPPMGKLTVLCAQDHVFVLASIDGHRKYVFLIGHMVCAFDKIL